MNLPVPDALKMRFSLVIDGGTLEHVFNFPVAIQNCMDMTALGGCCMVIAPANNFMGHGFYQFSPELYFRVFCARNGFEVRDAIVYGAGVAEPWYQVTDPNQARARVLLANTKPTYIAVLAKRTALMPLFAEPPQQSDYVERWTNTPVSTRRSGQLATELARKFLPGPLRDYTNHWLGRLRFGLSHRHYVRMRDPFDGMRAWSTPASPGCV